MIEYEELYKYTSKLNVLYVEDDIEFREEASEIFCSLFNKVDMCINGVEALEKYNEYFEENGTYYDIVISDINMPKMNGLTLTKEIYKKNPSQAIIIISAHSESNYLLEFVNIGIEKFLLKPLDLDNIMEVFLDLSKKIIENKKELSTSDDTSIKIGEGLEWNKNDSILYKNNKAVKLTYKEIELIKLFIKNKNKVSTHEEILTTVWNDDMDATTHSLKCLVSRLRKKIPSSEIESISKIGYKLVF